MNGNKNKKVSIRSALIKNCRTSQSPRRVYCKCILFAACSAVEKSPHVAPGSPITTNNIKERVKMKLCRKEVETFELAGTM
jgi:hypothetical protein